MEGLASFFRGLWDSFTKFMRDLMLTLFDVIIEVFYFLFEMIILVVVNLLNGLTELGTFTLAPFVTALPLEVTQILSAIGFPEATAMIGVALFTRLLLQLIPFVRLGS